MLAAAPAAHGVQGAAPREVPPECLGVADVLEQAPAHRHADGGGRLLVQLARVEVERGGRLARTPLSSGSGCKVDGVARYDFAVFRDDQFVTNALLTEEEAERMEREGY